MEEKGRWTEGRERMNTVEEGIREKRIHGGRGREGWREGMKEGRT